jgi:hypothetical protein
MVEEMTFWDEERDAPSVAEPEPFRVTAGG